MTEQLTKAVQQAASLQCAMRYTPIWKPGVNGLSYQESNFACQACGYVGKHDTHPGCKLPAHQQALEVSDELILKTLRPDVWMHVEGHHREQMLADARAILALRPQAKGENK